MNAQTITCSRCKGKGIIPGHVVVCAGIPGGCFKCLTRGWVHKDKFDQLFADSKGEFYGFTTTWSHGLFVSKYIGRVEERDLLTSRDTKATKITEEQARKFFAKYGDHTYINKK